MPLSAVEFYEAVSSLAAECIAKKDLKSAAKLVSVAIKHRPCRHSTDFTTVLWHGTHYRFTASQGHVIHLLWDSFDNDTPDVRQEALLDVAGSESANIANLFKDHPAWGKLITSQSKGTYRLGAPVLV